MYFSGEGRRRKGSVQITYDGSSSNSRQSEEGSLEDVRKFAGNFEVGCYFDWSNYKWHVATGRNLVIRVEIYVGDAVFLSS